MSWGPITQAPPARGEPADPMSSDRAGHDGANALALALAREVFLPGNGLPGRWTGRERFVVLASGFGLGHTFLATWSAWRQHPGRCGRLWFVAIAANPPAWADFRHAHQGTALQTLADELAGSWPPLTPDLHLIDLDQGRVRLLLAFGDASRVLSELVLRADAFYLDIPADEDPSPSVDDRWLRWLPRLAAEGATLASPAVHERLRQGLRSAGFETTDVPGADGGQPTTAARFAPRFVAPPPPGRRPLERVRTVAVVGAGLAGAAVARALAAQGLAVTVVDRQPGCAGETSGNPGGLFHGVVHGHDGPHARWLRAAALHAERLLRPMVADGLPGAVDGLLRGEGRLSASAMRSLIDRLGLPADYLDVEPAGPGGRPAWRYPGGGWVSPPALCERWLAAPGIVVRYGRSVASLEPAGGQDAPGDPGTRGWRLLDAEGRCLAEADAVLLCNAGGAVPLLAGLGGAGADIAGTGGWSLQRQRGQTTLLPADLPGLPALPQPLADGGYAMRLSDGRLLCGGSAQPDDDDPALRPQDHRQHLALLRRLTGWQGDVDPATLQGRVGWRLRCDDRLPLLGPVPDARPAAAAAAGARVGPGRRLDQPRLVPRLPGLYLFTALGSRGITQAALGGEVLASWLSGAPVPAPASLLDALDPARFIARAARGQPAD